MRILAVDPGAQRIGVAVMEDDQLLHYTLLSMTRKGRTFTETLNARIIYCVEEFTKLIDEWKPEIVAIELVPSFSRMAHREQVMASTTVLKTLTVQSKIKLLEYAPRSWHKLFAGKADCTKDEVKGIVVEKFDLVTDMPYDVYDAIAIAIVAMEKNK
jgi:crossover junction endodeoxyribonuclease RuvC